MMRKLDPFIHSTCKRIRRKMTCIIRGYVCEICRMSRVFGRFYPRLMLRHRGQ